jgi:hypothetical protein
MDSDAPGKLFINPFVSSPAPNKVIHMPEQIQQPSDRKERVVLGPAAWWLYSSLLIAMAVIPFSVGAIYITRFPTDALELRIEYGVLMGLGLGAALSSILGYFLSSAARKNIE